MTKRLMMVVAALLVFGCLAWADTFVGVVSDSMCGAKHSHASAAAAACVKKCVSGGSAQYVLVSHGHVYTVDQQDKFAPYAGRMVRVEGTKNGDAITVSSVRAVHYGHHRAAPSTSSGTGSGR